MAKQSGNSSKKNPAPDAATANGKATGSPTDNPAASGDAPSMTVERQYIRSSSLESLAGSDRVSRSISKPEIKVGVEVGANLLAAPSEENVQRFEVTLAAEAQATDTSSGSLPLFTAKVVYAGIFALSNLNDQQRTFALGVEAPHLLFPFVRHILGNLSRDSGFPPVLLDNIDFASLLRQRIEAAQKENQDKLADTAQGDSEKLNLDGNLKFD